MIFRRSRTQRTLQDPILGTIRYDGTDWKATDAIARESDSVLVAMESGEEGPNDSHRSAFQRLAGELALHHEAISAALFDLYRPYQEFDAWQGPRAQSPEILRTMLELSNVRIDVGGVIELIFGFRGDRWPDAMFVLELDARGVRAVSLDD